MASEFTTVLPGDLISPETLPLSANRQLKLGPGLRHTPPSTLTATISGELASDAKKNAVWVEYSGGRYMPSTGDQIIVTVHRSAQDYYSCDITPHAPQALLPQLAFESVTKKTRPVLAAGALVYARVAAVSKHADTELECVNPATGKADGLGPLKGGMVWKVSLAFARRLMMGKRGGVVLLDELSKTVAFELAIGRNGKVWVNSQDNIQATLAVGKAIVEVDEKNLTPPEQVQLAKKTAKGLQ